MKNVDKFNFILKKYTEFNGLIPIYTKKGDEQNRFTYSATSPAFKNIIIFLSGINYIILYHFIRNLIISFMISYS